MWNQSLYCNMVENLATDMKDWRSGGLCKPRKKAYHKKCIDRYACCFRGVGRFFGQLWVKANHTGTCISRFFPLPLMLENAPFSFSFVCISLSFRCLSTVSLVNIILFFFRSNSISLCLFLLHFLSSHSYFFLSISSHSLLLLLF